MDYVLPLEINPPFKTFSIYANKQGIMLAQNKEAIRRSYEGKDIQICFVIN